MEGTAGLEGVGLAGACLDFVPDGVFVGCFFPILGGRGLLFVPGCGANRAKVIKN